MILVFWLDKIDGIHKDKDGLIILDKFNIVLQNSMEMLEWLRSLYSRGFEDGQAVAIAAYRSLKALQDNR